MIFRKPLDPFKDLTEEEQEERLESFRSNEITRKEERAMILGALRTFLPGVLLMLSIFVIVALLTLL